jgi:hypothetical protein
VSVVHSFGEYSEEVWWVFCTGLVGKVERSGGCSAEIWWVYILYRSGKYKSG